MSRETEELLYHHAILLRDQVRMEAYQRAIETTVKKDDIVVDIGCGLGVLAMMAAKAGAFKVYAVEADRPTYLLARKLIKQNRLDGKIALINGLSATIRPKEKVDVLVSEVFGNLGVNENIIPALIDARERWLKPSGKMIPREFTIHAVPITSDPDPVSVASLRQVTSLNMWPGGTAVMPIRSEAIPRERWLASSTSIATVDLLTETAVALESSVTFKVTKPGLLTGFAGWFETRLCAGVSFSTAPDGPATHWKQAFMPLLEPEKVAKGDTVTFYFRSEPDTIPPGPENVISYGCEIGK